MQVFSRQRSVVLALVGDGLAAPADATEHAAATRGRHLGFTIIELMVALTVAGILLVIAIPSFRQLTLSSRLTTATNDVVAAINVARMEAVKRNAGSQFCSDVSANNQTDTLGAACSTEVQPGAVYVMKADGTATRVLGAVSSITTPLQFKGSVTALRFTSQGVGQKAGQTTPSGDTIAIICTSSLNGTFQNIRTITITSGSIIQVTPSNGACP
ncbi:GspH/FimT family pseudopilin [Dyella jiangningensis]|uniref:Type II secretion system protein H n=1 Tax=Dyella jiangningensis TaxID=1379159 RepID=A0A328NZE6_9GAMM|nr:GspH/FimT family pseudopilin [Dyella jiangningensis]RAO75447.1 hypothetical protein CA260_15340 [Dyella jiangningensis]